MVKKKTWHQREDTTGLKWPMKRAKLWGPASDMSMSSRRYFVQDQGRFFRTTVVHHVWKLEEEGTEPQQREALSGEEGSVLGACGRPSKVSSPDSGDVPLVAAREAKEEKEAQVLDDAPGSAEEATWDIVKEPQGPEKLLREEMEVEGEIQPDISFAVGALGRMLHKRPKYAWMLGQLLLRYVYRTRKLGLWYVKCQQGDLGEADQLQAPRTTDRIDRFRHLIRPRTRILSFCSRIGCGTRGHCSLGIFQTDDSGIVNM